VIRSKNTRTSGNTVVGSAPLPVHVRIGTSMMDAPCQEARCGDKAMEFPVERHLLQNFTPVCL